MTIGVNTGPAIFLCDGTTKIFPVPLQAYQSTDFLVVLTNSTGGQTTLVLNSDYSLAASSTDSPPKWTLTTLAAAAYATGITLQVLVAPVVSNNTQYVQGQAFPSLAVQTNIDRLTQMVQRLANQVARSPYAPDGDIAPVMALPSAAIRANTVLGFDASGNRTFVTSVPSGTLSRGSVGALLYPITTQETAAGITSISDYGYWPGDVKRYGAKGDGITNDLAAIVSAFSLAKAAGSGTVFMHSNDNYYCGTVSTDGKTTPLASFTGLANTRILGNGATLSVNTTGNVGGCLFQLINPSNVSVYDLNFTDTGFDQSQAGNPNLHGTAPFFLTTSGASDYSGFTMVNCSASHALGLCTVYRAGTGRLKGLQFLNCRTSNIYTGWNFQQQGDDVDISNCVCINPVRAYFPYGVVNHTVDIAVWNDGTNVNAGSNALCDIKRYDFDTKDIRLRLAYHGDSSIYGSLVNLEADVTSAAPAIFDSIDIDLRLAAATVSGSSVGYPVQFRDVTGGSTVANTATQWKRITLRGDLGAWPIANVNNPINIASVPNTTRGTLAIPAGFFDVQTVYAQTFAGFQIQTRPNTYVTSMVGNLTAANSGACDARTIDLTNYTGTLFALRVTLYAEADANLGSTQQCYRRYLILGRNSAGTVTISSTNVENTYDAGAASVVTVTASGNFIQFALTVYSGVNANLRMETEHLSKFL